MGKPRGKPAQHQKKTAKPKAKPVCPYFLGGYCQFGKDCLYLHDNKAAKTAPRRNEICTFYARDKFCRNQDACPFLHPGFDRPEETEIYGTTDKSKIEAPAAKKADLKFNVITPGGKVEPQITPVTKIDTPLDPKTTAWQKPLEVTRADLPDVVATSVAFIDEDDDDDDRVPICPNWVEEGTCDRLNCQWAHYGDLCKRCGLYLLIPEHEVLCLEAEQRNYEYMESDFTEICMEVPPKVGRWFGLLTDCDHAFCLDCIRSWRQAQLTKEVVRSCPLCRQHSHYVIPCDRYIPEGTSKNKIVDEYKTRNTDFHLPSRLSKTKCKYLKADEPCPFGDSCFYDHGDYVPRYKVDDDGQSRAVSGINLADFLNDLPS